MIVVNSYFDSLFYVYFLWRKEQKAQNHQSRFQKFRRLLLGGARAKKNREILRLTTRRIFTTRLETATPERPRY